MPVLRMSRLQRQSIGMSGLVDLIAYEECKGLGVPGDWIDLYHPLFSCWRGISVGSLGLHYRTAHNANQTVLSKTSDTHTGNTRPIVFGWVCQTESIAFSGFLLQPEVFLCKKYTFYTQP